MSLRVDGHILAGNTIMHLRRRPFLADKAAALEAIAAAPRMRSVDVSASAFRDSL